MGFDGICVNEHHSSAYGLMSSPNLMALTLARRTSRSNLVVLGNSVCATRSAAASGRRIRDARLHLGRPPGGRVSGWYFDGRQRRLRSDTCHAARALPRSARSDRQVEDQPGAIRVQWTLHQTALCESMATACPEVNPPIWIHPPWWVGRDLGLDARTRLYVPATCPTSAMRMVKLVFQGFWDRFEQK